MEMDDRAPQPRVKLFALSRQAQVAKLSEDRADDYLREVVDETARLYGVPFTADYVRLDLWAVRPA